MFPFILLEENIGQMSKTIKDFQTSPICDLNPDCLYICHKKSPWDRVYVSKYYKVFKRDKITNGIEYRRCFDMVCYGAIWYGMVQYKMVCCGMVWLWYVMAW